MGWGMSGDFRRGAKETLARLLAYWQTIEVWLKKSEQISSDAVIPAINELRYASRQLYNAVRLYGQYRLSPGEQSSLSRRLILAEQYLMNADHDIGDAITSFYRSEVDAIESEFDAPAMRQYFGGFDQFRQLVARCEELILDSRYNYDARARNYYELREVHVTQLRLLYPRLIEAHALARYDKQKLQTELVRAKGRADFFTWLGAIGVVVAIVGMAFAVYAWFEPASVFCHGHTKDMLAQLCAASTAEAAGPSVGEVSIASLPSGASAD